MLSKNKLNYKLVNIALIALIVFLVYLTGNLWIGITGKINREDEKNKYGENNVVFISIYDKSKNIHYEYKLDVLDISTIEPLSLAVALTFKLSTSYGKCTLYSYITLSKLITYPSIFKSDKEESFSG